MTNMDFYSQITTDGTYWGTSPYYVGDPIPDDYPFPGTGPFTYQTIYQTIVPMSDVNGPERPASSDDYDILKMGRLMKDKRHVLAIVSRETLEPVAKFLVPEWVLRHTRLSVAYDVRLYHNEDATLKEAAFYPGWCLVGAGHNGGYMIYYLSDGKPKSTVCKSGTQVGSAI